MKNYDNYNYDNVDIENEYLIGLEVICVSLPPDELTIDPIFIGEKYHIDYVVNEMYILVERNYFQPYHKSHFKTLSEIRKEKIKKLNNIIKPKWYRRLLNGMGWLLCKTIRKI